LKLISLEDDILEQYRNVIQKSSQVENINNWLDVVENVRKTWKEAMNKRKQPTEVLESEASPPKNPPSKKKKLQATDLIY